MKNKINIVFLGLFILLMFPFKIYARSYDAWGSTCPSSELPTFGRFDGSHYSGAQSFCKNDTNAGSSDTGMNKCAIEELRRMGVDGAKYKTESIDNGKRIRMYFYDSGRIDAWVGRDGYWEVAGGLGIQVCPLMDLSYNVSDPLPTQLQDKNNVELISIEALNFNNSKPDPLNQSTFDFWNTWKVENYTVSKIGLDKANNEFSYNVYVGRLTAMGDNAAWAGLGWNGISGGGEDVSRVYHYWVPFVAVFEYDDPNYNQCKEQKYAYEHPNECCYEYPETCCGSDGSNGAATINDPNVWNSTVWNMQELCCNPNPEIDYNIYVNGEKLPTLKTFASYLNNPFIKEQYNQKCSGYEFSCKWNVDKSDQSHCCNYPEYQNDSRCKKSCSWNVNINDSNHCCKTNQYKNTSRCKNIIVEKNKCNNADYFSSHREECCESADEETFEKNALICCPITTQQTNSNWNKVCDSSDDEIKKYDDGRNRTCKNQPWEREYTVSNSEIQVTETLEITSTSYPNKNNAYPMIDAGQGFEYNLKIMDTVSITGNEPSNIYSGGGYKWCDNLEDDIDDYNEAMKTAYDRIDINNLKNQVLTFKQILPGVGNTKEYRYMFANDNNDNNSNGDETTVILTDLKSQIPEISTRRRSYRCIDHYESYYDRYGRYRSYPVYNYNSYNVIQSISFDVSYNMMLPKYYINQVGGDDSYNNYTGKKPTITSNYLDGGNKIYTSVNDESGYYNFEISINNGGLLGEINSGNKPYTCSYLVANCIKDGTCIDDDDPDPPDDETPPIKVNNTPYYFRPISLTNPFPNNRDIGPNWFGQALNSRNTKVEEYITGTSTNIKGDTVYSDPIYSIKLTPDLISRIQKYNDLQDSNKGYLDWDTLSTEYNSVERTSNFLTCLLNGTNCNSNADSANLGKIDNIKLPSNNERRKKIGDFSEDGD